MKPRRGHIFLLGGLACLGAALWATQVLAPANYQHAGALPDTLSDRLPEKDGWIELFDGRSLNGWTPKFTGAAAGVNLHNTWRVDDGELRADYSDWPDWQGQFGHLFYQAPQSAYVLQLEYRFSGEQVTGSPLMQWAWRNSGVMFHSEGPDSMRTAQQFPVSLEAQLLGTQAGKARSTGNLCTPDTHVHIHGKLHTTHCTNGMKAAVAGDSWVRFELEVHPDGTIRHFVNGELAIEYSTPVLDIDSEDGARLGTTPGAGDRSLSAGFIALQAESHPVHFRRIRLYPLAAPQ